MCVGGGGECREERGEENYGTSKIHALNIAVSDGDNVSDGDSV